MSLCFSLGELGWQPFFQQQLSMEEWDAATPARVVEQHKSELEVATEAGARTLEITHAMPPLTVGDWILLDDDGLFLRDLERKSCFSRKAPGSKLSRQLIAANVDTAFIVCSMNEDFNLNRIERYLSVVNNAEAEPVVVLSKIDLCADPQALSQQVQALDNMLCVVSVNSLSSDSVSQLMPWCNSGKTVVLLGSSGAGKSTLSNRLLDDERQDTGSIREGDAKGRHTTTRRSLLKMPAGAMILDTPGMRELQLADCEDGIANTFSDIIDLADDCRFGDCQHGNEPGCAVQAAIETGALDERRLSNYLKLSREQALNSASLAQRRASDKDLSKYYKRTQGEAKKLKGR